MELLPQINHKFDMVFADPPYFLSNDGLSIQSGKLVSVNKGKWDKSQGTEFVNNFNREWLTKIREKMKEDATIWISGTMHNIFSVGQILTELDFKILNIDKLNEIVKGALILFFYNRRPSTPFRSDCFSTNFYITLHRNGR